MNAYRLTIDGPLWPTLSAMNGKTRRTLSAARVLAWQAMCDVVHGLSLLDRQCAHDALAVCTAWDANEYPNEKGSFARHEIGPFVFTITMEK